MVPQVVVALIGMVLVGSALWDAFETVVLLHRVARRWRFARIYYRSTWLPYRAFAQRFKDGPRREAVLSYYGPSSLLLLVALWAGILVLGFASLQWSVGSALTSTDNHPISGPTCISAAPRSSLSTWATSCLPRVNHAC